MNQKNFKKYKNVVWILFLSDFILTTIGISKEGIGIEGNPIAVFFMELFGVFGLFLLCFFIGLGIFYLFKLFEFVVVVEKDKAWQTFFVVFFICFVTTRVWAVIGWLRYLL